jgi:ADP-heptose:LPS heptosyltransferase
MSPLKRLEVFAKLLLATLAAALLYRPRFWQRADRALGRRRKVLLVRIDARVGEALLTTPLLAALRALPHPPEVHVLVHQKVARVLRDHPLIDRLSAFDRRALFLGPWAPGIRALRRERYDVVVDCGNWEAPSVTSALVSRLIGTRAAVLGPALPPVGWLRTHPVRPLPDTRSEAAQRLHLLSPLTPPATDAALSFRKPAPSVAVQKLISGMGTGTFAVVNPGGRLGWRRVPLEAFGAAARALVEAGIRPVITYGPGEEELAYRVNELAPGSLLPPPTTLDDLAGLMQAARLTVCNNTGPMHLSVAVGTPTLGLFLRMEVERWGHPRAPHRMFDLTPILDQDRDLLAEVELATEAFIRTLPAERFSA